MWKPDPSGRSLNGFAIDVRSHAGELMNSRFACASQVDFQLRKFVDVLHELGLLSHSIAGLFLHFDTCSVSFAAVYVCDVQLHIFLKLLNVY